MLDGEEPKKLLWRRRFLIAIFVLVFPLVVAISYFASGTLGPSPLSFNLGLRGNLFFGGNPTTIPQIAEGKLFPNFLNFSLPSFPSINVGEVLLLIVILIALALIFRVNWHRTKKMRRFEEPVAERIVIAEILEDAAVKLGLGSGYRETVLRCYKAISQILEEKSTINGRTMTAREFRKEVSNILKFDSPYLGRVTELFEHARYSSDDVTMEEAKSASECLSKLAEALKSISRPTDELLNEIVS